MKTASPLRYPGGKSAMAGLLSKIRELNGLQDRAIAEPFAGGAGAALSLLISGKTPEVFINDADPAIHDFWWAVVNRSGAFTQTISMKRVSMSEWRRQRDIYNCSRSISRIRRAFSVFYLNRCNRSGIIMKGGPIGGIKQNGSWKLDARFNKKELIRRCKVLADNRRHVHVSGQDGLTFIRRMNKRAIFFFIDPPYFHKGKTLYLNALERDYHEALAAQLKSMHDSSWIATYDDCPEIRQMYRDWARIRPFCLRYVASERRDGREILITPKWMRLPGQQSSASIDW